MTDEHPVRVRVSHSKPSRHRCVITSVPMKRTNKAASKRAVPPSVIKRALERAKQKKAEKALTVGTRGADNTTAPSSPPPKKTKLTPSKASGVVSKSADVDSKSDDPCVATPAKAASVPTPTNAAQDTSVSDAEEKKSREDEERVSNDASKSTPTRSAVEDSPDSDAVDYGSSDADVDQHSESDVTESVRPRTMSVDSYRKQKADEQGSHDEEKPASATSSPKRLPSPPVSPRTTRSDDGQGDDIEEGEEQDVLAPPPIEDFRKRNPSNARGTHALGVSESKRSHEPERIIHNGEPDSDDDDVHGTPGQRYVSRENPARPVTSVRPTEPPTGVAVHSRIPPVEQWPVGITPRNLLWKAVVRPSEYYDLFARMKRQARTMGNPMSPIPVVLHEGETMEQYRAAFMSSLRQPLSADPTRQRNQWCSFALRRMQWSYGSYKRPLRRYGSPQHSIETPSHVHAGRLQQGQGRRQRAARAAPTSLGLADNLANAPSTQQYLGGGGAHAVPVHGSVARHDYQPTQQAAVAENFSTRSSFAVELLDRIATLERANHSLREDLARVEDLANRAHRLDRQGYDRLRDLLRDLERRVEARSRSQSVPTTREVRSPSYSPEDY